MLFKEKAYLQFLARSKNQYGIHSPFVYRLLTKCFYDKRKLPTYKTLDQNRRNLCIIHGKTKISQVGLTPKRARLLHRLVSYFEPNCMLDYSDSYGLAASALSTGHSGKVFSFLGETERFKTALKDAHNLQGVTLDLPEWIKKHPPPFPDFVFIGSRKAEKKLLEVYEQVRPIVGEETLLIFEGIHRSKETERDWENIKSQKEVTLTLDLFYWGMVFFKKGRAKQHFVIRA